MKTLTTVLVLVSIIFLSSCKKNEIDTYTFPEQISVDKLCIPSWKSIGFTLGAYGTNVSRFEVVAWFGVDEKSIITDPSKAVPILEGNGNVFLISNSQVQQNNFIFVQLKGYGDKGLFGVSQLYKYKKDDTNGCVKWTSI